MQIPELFIVLMEHFKEYAPLKGRDSMRSSMKVETVNGLRYYVIDGQSFPSVTSILSLLPRPELEMWRKMVGEEEAEKIAQERSVIGKAAHFRILSKYSLRALELPSVYLPWKNTIEWLKEINYRCELAHVMWQEVIDGIDFEPLYVEHSLVSRKHRFAGTFDLLAKIYDKNTLIDLKTSKELWESYKLQLGAYYLLCIENKLKVDLGMLIGLHPFLEENPDLKAKTVWLNRKELEEYGRRFLKLVEKFYESQT